MDLSTYLAIARRWVMTLIVATGIAAGAGYLVASATPPSYESQVKLLVGPISADANTVRGASELAQTYAQLVTSDEVLAGVVEETGLRELPATILREAIDARADTVTRIITITVRTQRADHAAALATALANQLQALESEGPAVPEGELRVIDAAERQDQPVAPQLSFIISLAAGAGLLSALLLVVAVELLSDSIKDRSDLTELTGAPFLGVIGMRERFRPSPARPLLSEALPESNSAVAYRLLASKIPAGSKGQVRSLLVVGSQASDGAGEFAANLAAVLTRSGRRTVLVDANEVDGVITRLFSAEELAGLNEWLQWKGALRESDAILDDVIIEHPLGLRVVPHGAAATGLLDVDGATQLLQRLAKRADALVINAAPIHRSGSTLMWARAVDDTILVAERERTRRENVSFAVESLRIVGASLAGTVLLDHYRPIFSSGAATAERQQVIERRRQASRRGAPQPAQSAMRRPSDETVAR